MCPVSRSDEHRGLPIYPRTGTLSRCDIDDGVRLGNRGCPCAGGRSPLDTAWYGIVQSSNDHNDRLQYTNQKGRNNAKL